MNSVQIKQMQSTQIQKKQAMQTQQRQAIQARQRQQKQAEDISLQDIKDAIASDDSTILYPIGNVIKSYLATRLDESSYYIKEKHRYRFSLSFHEILIKAITAIYPQFSSLEILQILVSIESARECLYALNSDNKVYTRSNKYPINMYSFERQFSKYIGYNFSNKVKNKCIELHEFDKFQRYMSSIR